MAGPWTRIWKHPVIDVWAVCEDLTEPAVGLRKDQLRTNSLEPSIYAAISIYLFKLMPFAYLLTAISSCQ